ncbi:MAG: hypothetical protein GQ565_06280 [Candidatus Aegiribacteria sp.]|nr:hypothetical protein [Candidatus Aegiribacteria sp.]
MKISDYLQEIQLAVETVICEIHREHQMVKALQAELAPLTAATEDDYRRVEFLALNPDLDDEGLGTAIYWDTYFGSDKERFHKASEVEEVTHKLDAHKLSIAALSGSLLQYAKQGIALQYGKERLGCPDGRMIADISLNDIIWQGRNQAIHWEEGHFSKPVERCFQQLADRANPLFNEYKSRNMAYEVVSYLGWSSFNDFAKDLKLLDV